MSFNTLLTIVI